MGPWTLSLVFYLIFLSKHLICNLLPFLFSLYPFRVQQKLYFNIFSPYFKEISSCFMSWYPYALLASLYTTIRQKKGSLAIALVLKGDHILKETCLTIWYSCSVIADVSSVFSLWQRQDVKDMHLEHLEKKKKLLTYSTCLSSPESGLCQCSIRKTSEFFSCFSA